MFPEWIISWTQNTKILLSSYLGPYPILYWPWKLTQGCEPRARAVVIEVLWHTGPTWGCIAEAQVQETPDLQPTRNLSVCWDPLQTYIRPVISVSSEMFWIKYIAEAFSHEALIGKFLSSWAAELKAWVSVPWAKELEPLDEYYHKCGSVAFEMWQWSFVWKFQPVHKCTLTWSSSKHGVRFTPC